MSKKINILGVMLSPLTPALAVDQILSWIKDKHKAYVCIAPVSTLVDANRNETYKNIINQADMVAPDGMPVVWLLRAKGHRFVERTYGPDLMRKLCAHEGVNHFFFGGTEDTLKRLEQSLKKVYSRISIVGMQAPPFRAHPQVEDADTIGKINSSGADILWVGLGSPKQDVWMSLNRSQVNVPVMVGVGAAFDFLSGVKQQAPKWMQNIGLEWVFRLCSEPKRLWRRYLIGNSLFIFYLIRDSFLRKNR